MRNTFVATGLVSALVLISSHQPTRAQDLQPDLDERIGKLEQRVTTLERLLLVQSGVTVAESRLAAAEETLQYTERLHKKGFVTQLQLEAGKLAVARALKELQLAKAAQKEKKSVLEIEVLKAEHNLSIATAHLRFSERLRQRGFVTELQVKADKFVLEKARNALERAKAKLKTYQQSLKDADNKKRK